MTMFFQTIRLPGDFKRDAFGAPSQESMYNWVLSKFMIASCPGGRYFTILWGAGHSGTGGYKGFNVRLRAPWGCLDLTALSPPKVLLQLQTGPDGPAIKSKRNYPWMILQHKWKYKRYQSSILASFARFIISITLVRVPGIVAQIGLTNSLYESSMITGGHKQLGPHEVQNHELIVFQW